MPTYRLHYFDIRGRGECIRLLFSAAGQKFEDKRYTRDEWNHFKPKTPFGQLPVLDIDGKLYGQSGAIGQYLARAFGLYGKNNIDALNIDIVFNCARDFVQAYSTAMFEKDENKKKELMAKLASDVIPSYITQTENLIGSSGYFVGNSLTYADIGVYDTVDNILRLKDDAVNNSPKLLNNRKLVESNPRLSTYLKNRK